jgi:hypothetical protein
MIRRLQPIEPPKLALPTDKAKGVDDGSDQESLAAEFKKLLDKARGGIAGARDEVVALGFALSQAVSTVRQHHQEIKKAKDDEGETSAVEREDSSDLTAVDQTVQVTRPSGPQKTEQKEVSSQGIGEQEHQQADTEVEVSDDQEINLDDGFEEIVLDEDVVYSDLTDLSQDTEVAEDSGQVLTDVTTAEEQVVSTLVTGQQDTSSRVETAFDTKVSRQVTTEGDEGDDADDYFADDMDDQQIIRTLQTGPNRAQAKSNSGSSHQEQRIDLSEWEEVPVQDVAGPSVASREMFESDALSRPQQAGPQRLGVDNDAARLARAEAAQWSQLSSGELFSRTREQNGELSMQLTLLRHAYDALKSQTQGQAEVKAKTSTAGVSGVGASQEAKSLQNDNAPKAARYLNRAATARMLDRIESALKEAARSRDGKTISLKLDPVQLGQVKVDVSLRDGALHARITPQNGEVLQALRDHSQDLQGALRRLGLNVDRVTVQVTSEVAPTSFENTAGFADGKGFQQEGHNMPQSGRQPVENTFGNEFADVTKAGISDAGIAPADHWIA